MAPVGTMPSGKKSDAERLANAKRALGNTEGPNNSEHEAKLKSLEKEQSILKIDQD